LLFSNFLFISVATFWTNPQYQVHIAQADSDNKNGNGTIIVELMQKDRRKLRRDGKTELTIGYAIYKVLLLCWLHCLLNSIAAYFAHVVRL
jgi:hypothetical protein